MPFVVAVAGFIVATAADLLELLVSLLLLFVLLPLRWYDREIATAQFLELRQVADSGLELIINVVRRFQPVGGFGPEKPLEQSHMHRIRQQILSRARRTACPFRIASSVSSR